jgi:hypothetical protein
LHSHPPKPFTFFDSNKWKNVRFVAGHESGKRVTLGGTATVQDDNYLKGGFLQIIKKNRSQRARETHMYYYTTTQAYRCSVLLVTNSTLPKDYECGGGGGGGGGGGRGEAGRRGRGGGGGGGEESPL